MQRYAARQLNVCAEACVRGLPEQRLRTLQRIECFARIAGGVGNCSESAQCERLTSRVSELVLQIERLGVRLLREFPFLQGFVRPAEVVERDRYLALEPGFALRLERARIDVNR